MARSSDAWRSGRPYDRVEPHVSIPAFPSPPPGAGGQAAVGSPGGRRDAHLAQPPPSHLPPPAPLLLPSESGSVRIRRRGNNDPCSCIAENLGGGGGASCGRGKRGFSGAQENSRGTESKRATWGARRLSTGLGPRLSSVHAPRPGCAAQTGCGGDRLRADFGTGRVGGGCRRPAVSDTKPYLSLSVSLSAASAPPPDPRKQEESDPGAEQPPSDHAPVRGRTSRATCRGLPGLSQRAASGRGPGTARRGAAGGYRLCLLGAPGGSGSRFCRKSPALVASGGCRRLCSCCFRHSG